MVDGVSKPKAVELVRAWLLPDDTQTALIELARTGAPVEQVAAAVRRARLEHGFDGAPVVPAATLTRQVDRVRVEATLDLVDGEHLEVALDTMADQMGGAG